MHGKCWLCRAWEVLAVPREPLLGSAIPAHTAGGDGAGVGRGGEQPSAPREESCRQTWALPQTCCGEATEPIPQASLCFSLVGHSSLEVFVEEDVTSSTR